MLTKYDKLADQNSLNIKKLQFKIYKNPHMPMINYSSHVVTYIIGVNVEIYFCPT